MNSAPFLILRDLPGVAEVEALVTAPGGAWRVEDGEAKAIIDRTSVSLFGITEDDTYKLEPNLRDFVSAQERDLLDRGVEMMVSAVRRDELDAAYDAYVAWNANFNILYDESVLDEDRDTFWQTLGVDVLDAGGDELECLHQFSRQLIVVARGLMPGAVLSPAGDGTKARQDTDKWAAALEAQAKAFSQKNRK